MDDAAPHTNRLAGETSPYLLQHQHNPVDWWPWGTEALAEAQKTGKPILLSVGYAACHWCHVMAHESFEDAATAEVMNELFVCIKVDREERPDIDQIYMRALHLLGQQGGWPMTMFLSPDGAPIWGGTYFPNTPQYGRPSFVGIMREFIRIYRDEPDKIAANKTAIERSLVERSPTDTASIGLNELDNVAGSIARSTDPDNGGLRGAPKFPQCSMLEFLWRAGARTGDDRFFTTINLALTRMSQGGIYDHLGGGYARYTVDDKWLVPHFEKMLYDNAQILDLLALEHARAPNVLYRQRAEETVGWLKREMLTREGGFASSLDADSEGEEGRFYIWSQSEIEDLLGKDDATFFAAKYGVTADGDFEGRNILNRLGDDSDTATEAEQLAAMRAILFRAREKRMRPGLDDKVLADWNGLTIAALVHAAQAFARPDWLTLAATAFGFIATTMSRHGRLGHSWRAGKLLQPALASDNAAMIRAALALHEATGDHLFLDQAVLWQADLDTHYGDPRHGGYFLTSDDAEGLILRPHSSVDDATPNHIGLTAQNLARLAVLTGDDRWRKQLDTLFSRMLAVAGENAFGHLSLLNALDLYLAGAEIVVTGEGEEAEALLKAARALPHATTIVLHVPDPAKLPAHHPANDKVVPGGGAAAFVCRGQTCSLPVSEPDALAALVRHEDAVASTSRLQ
ncbi:thioredoxin domain-containing protein [Afipia carboxidovorans]|uniref:thioredoxin domain-containing protein n=1 Tax=Afipia carboxidovorans TaxID=40137 RepID=UPI003091C54C|nr:thioredoxin domain-containing protein [Afipia carboxidovorans]